MTDKLLGLLLGYIKENNPDLMFQLEQDDALHQWVIEKIQEVELVLNNSRPTKLTEAAFMEIFASDMQPARFRYIKDLLEAEFTDIYESMLVAGTLNYELVNIVCACHDLFDDMPLMHDMENPQLDHAVAVVINEYLQMTYE